MENKKKVAEKEKRLPLQISDYDEIFSDFDPRPFHHKALSVDFLDEAKRAMRDKGEGVELKFFIPKEKRDAKKEILIKKRLSEHFQKHHKLIAKERKSVINKGVGFIFGGIVLMFIATYISFKHESTMLTTFLVVLLEPGGWFLFWEGLNLAIFESKKFKNELEFHKKMSKCDIEFVNH